MSPDPMTCGKRGKVRLRLKDYIYSVCNSDGYCEHQTIGFSVMCSAKKPYEGLL